MWGGLESKISCDKFDYRVASNIHYYTLLKEELGVSHQRIALLRSGSPTSVGLSVEI